MLEQVAGLIEKHGMFSPGMRVGVAVSGGADSMCLLHVLHGLTPRWNLHLSVIHVDHGIRGAVSREDAEFVRQAAAGFALPFQMLSADAPAVDDNLEQAARHIRLKYFRELRAAGTVERVATGHTLSDQAETVLYRLIRGAGLAGLCGVLPVTEDGLVRPLLEVTRAKIEAWLTEHSIAWREDETNQERSYDRNRLRHEILPLLRKTFNPNLDSVLAHLAVLSQDEEDYWNREILPRATVVSGQPAVVKMAAAELTSVHPALARRLIRRALGQVKGDLRQINFAHVETVLALAGSVSGSGRVQLPGLDVFRSFDWLRIAPAGYDSNRIRDFEFTVKIPGSITLPSPGESVTFELIPAEKNPQSRDKLEHELDWQRLTLLSESDPSGQGRARSSGFELRNWRPGDHYRRVGQSQTEKLKTLFQETRIPLWERRNWPVLTCSGKILWTRRFGPAAEVACDSATRTVLRIQDEDCPE